MSHAKACLIMPNPQSAGLTRQVEGMDHSGELLELQVVEERLRGRLPADDVEREGRTGARALAREHPARRRARVVTQSFWLRAF